jgi:hypothetical protein
MLPLVTFLYAMQVEAASHSLGLLLEYLQTLEDCWTGVRWIRDVLSGIVQCLVFTGVLGPGCLSWILDPKFSIPVPGFRIPDPGSESTAKNLIILNV